LFSSLLKKNAFWHPNRAMGSNSTILPPVPPVSAACSFPFWVIYKKKRGGHFDAF